MGDKAEVAKAGSNKLISLRHLARKNSILSLLLFVVLIAIIVMASLRDRESTDMLVEVYEDQFRIEQFKATLSNVMLPLNDFTMTAEASNFPKIRKAVKDYRLSYDRIKSIPHLTVHDKTALNQVDGLMKEVMNIANDVADGKIMARQSAQVTLLAQNLVLAAQKKLQSIVQGLEKQLEQSSAGRQQQADMQLYMLLGFIVFIVLLLEFLNRSLLRQANTVSRVSSSVAESAGDIIMVNKMQASATDQQTRFMEKVIQGLKLIAESGAKISTSMVGLEKNTGIISSFAKGGAQEMDHSIKAIGKAHAKMGVAPQQVEAAERKSGQILESLKQIQDIADEAQLLALNASIDGAGQGVSPLNHEVQRMADQIRESCEQMRQVVQDMSKFYGEASTERMALIEQSLEVSRSTSAMLVRIEKMSEKNGRSVAVIALATERQNERNMKILQALQHISELLHISGNKMQAYSDASARLSEASESLQNLS